MITTAQFILKNSKKRLQAGFTLIELLVVIGILAILLQIVLIAINPGRQFAQANNTQRRSDILALLNAIDQYAVDNAGIMPEGLPTLGNSIAIDSSGTGLAFCSSITPRYIAALPIDPQNGIFTNCNSYNTRYRVFVATVAAGSSDSNRITVFAPNAELNEAITVTR